MPSRQSSPRSARNARTKDPARVAQHRHQEVHDDLGRADADALLTEVDLHLVPRRRLEAHGRDLGRALRLALVLHRALHRPHARGDAARRELLLDHDRVALRRRREELPRLRASVAVQPLSSWSSLRPGLRATHVAAHRVSRQPELGGDPLRAPAQRRQLPQLPDHLRLHHLDLLRLLRSGHRHVPRHLSPPSPRGRGRGSVLLSSGGHFSCRLTQLRRHPPSKSAAHAGSARRTARTARRAPGRAWRAPRRAPPSHGVRPRRAPDDHPEGLIR